MIKAQVQDRVEVEKKFFQLISLNEDLSVIMDHACSFKPEVAIILELYESEVEGRVLQVSSVGLKAGIPQTTTIRYIRYLEERGWVTRSQHSTDGRVQYIRISPAKYLELNQLFAA